MINEIKVKPNTTASHILFFDNIDLTQLPNRRIVPLYGANGSGKTTLLKEIHFAMYERGEDKTGDDIGDRISKALKRQHAGVEHNSQIEIKCDDEKTVYYKYRNGQDNFQVMEPKSYTQSFDPMFINLKFNAKSLSEGQSIVYSVEDLLKGMLRSTKRHESFIEDDNTHAVVLLDEIDSGLSIDNLDRMLKIIQKVLRQGRNIQFFMSFNNPYVIKYFPDVISMYDGNIHHFDNMEEMLEDLKANQNMLDKARKSRGKYKIFD